jgi:hypothetical protein
LRAIRESSLMRSCRADNTGFRPFAPPALPRDHRGFNGFRWGDVKMG